MTTAAHDTFKITMGQVVDTIGYVWWAASTATEILGSGDRIGLHLGEPSSLHLEQADHPDGPWYFSPDQPQNYFHWDEIMGARRNYRYARFRNSNFNGAPGHVVDEAQYPSYGEPTFNDQPIAVFFVGVRENEPTSEEAPSIVRAEVEHGSAFYTVTRTYDILGRPHVETVETPVYYDFVPDSENIFMMLHLDYVLSYETQFPQSSGFYNPLLHVRFKYADVLYSLMSVYIYGLDVLDTNGRGNLIRSQDAIVPVIGEHMYVTVSLYPEAVLPNNNQPASVLCYAHFSLNRQLINCWYPSNVTDYVGGSFNQLPGAPLAACWQLNWSNNGFFAESNPDDDNGAGM